MDEYADEQGNIAGELAQFISLQYEENFYAKLEASLRPPEKQIQGPTTPTSRTMGR